MEQFGNQESWYPFVARAELLVENSDASLVADVRELSRQGCRLRLSGRPTPGASVVVKIYAWPHLFRARGTVRYSDPILGVCIGFTEIETQCTYSLDALLREAEGNQRNKSG